MDPCEFETLMDLNWGVSEFDLETLGGVTPETARFVTRVEVNCPETLLANSNNSERVKPAGIAVLNKKN